MAVLVVAFAVVFTAVAGAVSVLVWGVLAVARAVLAQHRGQRRCAGWSTNRRAFRYARRLILLAALAIIVYWHRQSSFTAATVMFVVVASMLVFILAMASRRQT